MQQPAPHFNRPLLVAIRLLFLGLLTTLSLVYFLNGLHAARASIIKVVPSPPGWPHYNTDTCGWKYGGLGLGDASVVNVVINQNITNPNHLFIRDIAASAWESWGGHNQLSNCSRVAFRINGPRELPYADCKVNTQIAIPGATAVTVTTGECKIKKADVAINHLVLSNSTDTDKFTKYIKKIWIHEAGHTMGLEHVAPPFAGNLGEVDCSAEVKSATCMNHACGADPVNDNSNYISSRPTAADNTTINCVGVQRTACVPPQGGGGSGQYPVGCQPVDPQLPNGQCPTASAGSGLQTYFSILGTTQSGMCCYASPIVIDLDGDAFNLTECSAGVEFDIVGSGIPAQCAWTAATADDAWLALDRDKNGTIDDGSELFGNFTMQPRSDNPNGFEALKVFDGPKFGGNNDGKIGPSDDVFTYLRLWRDVNHDGISSPSELYTLSSMNIVAIDLNYVSSHHSDPHGNEFKYVSKVYVHLGGGQGVVERLAVDVYLRSENLP